MARKRKRTPKQKIVRRSTLKRPKLPKVKTRPRKSSQKGGSGAPP